MNLRYNRNLDFNFYDIKCPNIAFYRYWRGSLPHGIYKRSYFGLRFLRYSKLLANIPSGIKINYKK